MTIKKKIKELAILITRLRARRDSLPRFSEARTVEAQDYRIKTEIELRLYVEEVDQLTRDAAWIEVVTAFAKDHLALSWEKLRDMADDLEKAVILEAKKGGDDV